MLKLVVTRRAAIDLEDILAFSIANFGEEIALRYAADLDAAIRRIGAEPRLGRVFQVRQRTFRQLNCRSHGIFYAADDDTITIARVLHLAMDFTRHLPP